MLEVDAGRGIGTEELAAAKILADGKSVADGSLGRVRRGIGGIVERWFEVVCGVGRSFCAGGCSEIS